MRGEWSSQKEWQTAPLPPADLAPYASPMDSPADPAVQIRGLNWAYVLMGAADGTLLPFIPLYLFERGLSAAWIGLVIATPAAAPLTTGLAWAYLADRRFSPDP